MVKFTDPCPTCFMNKGFSVIMQEEDGIYTCPQDSAHKFKKDEDGYFVRV